MFELVLVVSASVAMWLGPPRVPPWVGPLLGALLAIVVGSIAPSDAVAALGEVTGPLLFLVAAVPLAVTLDHLGVFAALAASVDGEGDLTARLWWLAAAVVTVFNLDAAVVLLTPLYIRIARRHGLDVVAVAFQPALLACLASGVLPVSNLTNLIVVERHDLGVVDFLAHSAPASLAATVVGYLAYRRVLGRHQPEGRTDEAADRAALWRGVPIIGFVLVGFTVGDVAGVPAWMVAGVALAWASILARTVLWRVVPCAAVLTTVGLVVLVAAAVPELPLERWFDAEGPLGTLRTVVAASALSSVTNNLPVALAGSRSIGSGDDAWALLVGTNVGSMFVLTASLSTLLWRDTAARSGVAVTAREWTVVAARVGAPALVAAVAVLAVTG